jgi:hypothetical protein
VVLVIDRHYDLYLGNKKARKTGLLNLNSELFS